MLDYLAIFRALNNEGVRYIVAGGMAVNLHGIPRMTYDIDLILDLEKDNLSQFLSLVKGWGFKPKIPVDIMDFTVEDNRTDWIQNRQMKAFNLVNPEWAISEIDILIDTPVTYLEASGEVVHFELNDILVPTISIDHLIEMKEKADRAQDRADVQHLKRIKAKVL